jgi:mRNA interferase RelE/StbE
MYDILFYKSAKDKLKKLPLDIQKRIVKVLERIRIRPFSFVERKVGTPYYKLRVGDYRLVLDVKQKELIILVIDLGHRSTVYKR